MNQYQINQQQEQQMVQNSNTIDYYAEDDPNMDMQYQL